MTKSVKLSEVQKLDVGQEVSWLHTQRGGWNLQSFVPATVVRVTEKRVILDAQLANGGTKRVSVKPENVYERRNGVSDKPQDYAVTPLIIHTQEIIPFNADNLSPEDTLEVIHAGCLVRVETGTKGIPLIGFVEYVKGETVAVRSKSGVYWRGSVDFVQILLTKAALQVETQKAAF